MTETDIPLPPEWLDLVHAWAPYALAALLCTTALVHALLPIARAVERWAARNIREMHKDEAVGKATHDLVAAPADRREILEIEVQGQGLDPRELDAAFADVSIVTFG